MGTAWHVGAVTALAASPAAEPNRFDPASHATSVRHAVQVPKATVGVGPTSFQPVRQNLAASTAPARIDLDPTTSASFMGSDGLLEVDVPAGAVSAADLADAGGRLSLAVRQVLPPSGSNSGGSGKYSFGTYLAQVVDASGHLAKRGLRKPLGFKLHADERAGALDLGHAVAVLNPSLPLWVDLNPPAAGTPPAAGAQAQTPSPPTPAAASGRLTPQRMALDAPSGTLSVTAAASSPSTAVSFDTDAPVATFGKPDPFETNLSGGGLTANLPLDMSAGPGGLTPPLTLAYSSAGVSDQHNAAGAAPWVGEGWNLTLGSISWAEHQVASTCASCTPLWEDSWQLSDPFGTGTDLVPPDINVKTFTDDTSNAITPNPVIWHTAPETRDKVISINSPATPGGVTPGAPCFRVFKPDGIMEEFGCTADSLQYYPQPSGANAGKAYVASWLLDMIVDPGGNQVHVTYQQDIASASGMSYPRDAVLSTVEYDSPGCHATQAGCTGSGWQPLMRVSFEASHAVAHPVTTGACPPNGSLRCDDPVDLTGSAGMPAPMIESTFVLNDVQLQVRASGSAAWNTLRDYQLGYSQSGSSTITDPVSGLSQSVAGGLLLGSMQEIGSDGSTALPARSFDYTWQTEYYEDSLGLPTPRTNCGPSWNNGNTPNGHTGCILWSQTYAGNSWYLSSARSGAGLRQDFTWQLARNNFHGVVSGSPANPFACNDSSVQASFPCNMPDDESWSRAVLTQRSDTTVRSSSGGSVTVTGTTSFSYQVPYPLQAQECSTCVASFYWGNQNDFDLLDFYNGKFFGFAQTTVQKPDGAADVHKFHTTEGWGLYDTGQSALHCDTQGGGLNNPCHDDPYSDLPNAAHGHEYELDQYATDGTTLLKQTRTQWQAVCPPAGVSGTSANPNYGNWNGNLVTELDHSNPVMVCEVHPLEVDRYTFDGSGGPSSHSATAYAYDGLGRVSSEAEIADGGQAAVADASGHGNTATRSGGVTEGVPGLAGDGDTSMSFDGVGGYVAGPALAPLQGDNTRSVELWFSTASTAQQYILDGGTAGASGQSFTIGLTNLGGVGAGPSVNTPGLYVTFWNADIYLPGLSLRDGRPHHVVVTLSGSSVCVYVDGATPNGLVFNGSTSSWSGSVGQPFSLPVVPNTAANPLWIGHSRTNIWGSGPTFFQGTVDEVAVYGSVLSPTRVQAHLTAGSGYRAAVLADSPTAYYQLADSGPSSSPSTMVHRPQYIWNDAVSPTAGAADGPYILDRQAFTDTEDPAGNRQACTYTTYDTYASNGWTVGPSSNLTLGRKTIATRYTNCGNLSGVPPSGAIAASYAYDGWGDVIAGDDPDANAGDSTHTGCSLGSFGPLTHCTTYDNTFETLQTTQANALNQVSTTGYQAPGAPAVADSSGHGNRAAPNGGLVPGAAGLVSGDAATSFDGGSAYVSGPSLTPLQGDGTRSVELWFSTTSTGQQPLVDSGNTGVTGQAFWLGLTQTNGMGGSPSMNTPGLLAAFWSDDVYLPGLSLADGHAHHVVMTLVGSGLVIYVDGATPSGLVWNGGTWSGTTAQPFTLPSQPNTAGNPLWIGHGRQAAWNTGSSYFTGTLDEVAIYDRALTAMQVQNHRAPAGGDYKQAVLADTPVAYYRLDDAIYAGFGLWPTSTTDPNVQTTSLLNDALGRVIGQTLPGETAGLTTMATAYSVWCSGTAAQAPCVEVDKTQRLNATTTVTYRAFYDGTGHLVETRSPAPGGQDVVQYSFYDPSQRLLFKSVPYFVTAYTGGPGPAAYSIPDSSRAGTTHGYDGLGRQTSATDPLSHKKATSRTVACSAAGTSDASCYEQTLTADANSHESGMLSDGLGRTTYEQRYTGNSGSTYTVYATARYGYDFLGNVARIVHPDGSTQTTFQYDMAGRKTGMTDPDRGSETYAYDPNDNLLKSTDGRGAAGSVFIGYDGLNRPLWHNTTNSATGAYYTFTYDSTANGNRGIGRLTGEGFASNSLSGSYAYVYDGRGRQVSLTEGFGSSSYPLQTSYDDAGDVLSKTYPTGEVVANGYTPQGWLSGVSTTRGTTTTALLGNAAYSGTGGAFGELTGATLGGGAYTLDGTYDLLDRATELSWKHAGATVFDQARTFDAAGTVSTIATTLPAGTDNQAFCYDEQDRLTWAAATGTPPCTGTAISAGTLGAARYTQSFTYDNMGRLATGPRGSYAYGDRAHVHAATAVGTAWTATYDAAGDMTCRAPTGASTCAGTATGAQLGYGPEGTMTSWQDRPSSPATTAAYLYDPQGQRAAQQVTQGGSTTSTVYVGDVEQVVTNGSTTTTTTYYYAGARRIALATNGTVRYLASDALGSASVALNASGSATASQLFAPYGGIRYSSGTMPTDYGFTGQRSDAATGLGYFGARYYDSVAGQFTSADTIMPGGGFDPWGLSRYAYVSGNPIARTDPTGHDGDPLLDPGGGGGCDPSDPSCGGGNDGGGGCPDASGCGGGGGGGNNGSGGGDGGGGGSDSTGSGGGSDPGSSNDSDSATGGSQAERFAELCAFLSLNCEPQPVKDDRTWDWWDNRSLCERYPSLCWNLEQGDQTSQDPENSEIAVGCVGYCIDLGIAEARRPKGPKEPYPDFNDPGTLRNDVLKWGALAAGVVLALAGTVLKSVADPSRGSGGNPADQGYSRMVNPIPTAQSRPTPLATPPPRRISLCSDLAQCT